MSDITYSNDMNDTVFDPMLDQAEPAGQEGASGAQTSPLHNFGVASLLVVAGVVVSGFLLTSEPSQSGLALPSLPVASWQVDAAAGSDSESWIDLADRAFASGRITDPVSDNALYYFHQAVLVNSADEQAQEGLEKVIAYVIGDAETAVYDSDWPQARRSAEHILALMPEHAGAKSVIERTNKFERIEELSRLAVNQLATDRLLSPRGDNALSSYRRIARIDPGNAEAAVGIATVAQRLVSKSQAAAIKGNFEASTKFMEQARSIAPNLGSVDQAAKLTDQFAKLTQEKAAEAELEASSAKAREAQAAEEAEAALQANSDRIFSVSDLTVERSVAPTFPRRTSGAQREGWVELNFRIDSQGGVFDAVVVRSSDQIFEPSALNAIRKWRFLPYVENGVSMPVRSGVRFSFRQ